LFWETTVSAAADGRCIDLRNDEGVYVEITLRGFLAYKTGNHPTRGEFAGTVLVLEKAACFDDSGEDMDSGYRDMIVSNVSHVHLTGFERMPDHGRPVTVTGKGFLSHTAWHLTRVLIDIDSIELLPLEE